MGIYSITCTIGSVPAWGRKRWDWFCSDIPSNAESKWHHQVRRWHNRTGHLTDELMTSYFKNGNPPPIFTFWPFELWPALPLPGREAGGSLQLFPPSSITWTLSHCSYHPKQLYIWKLSWLYHTHTHKNSLHRLLDTKRSLLVTKHTVCVNDVKHNCELHPNAYRLEPTVCWKCFLQLQ